MTTQETTDLLAGDGADAPLGAPTGPPRVRPQTLLLLFGANYMVDPGQAVSTGSLIAALSSVGVGEHAARSTISRMLRRGSLGKVRQGKRTYVHLTERTRETLLEGAQRAWRGPVNRDWDGQWTLLGFSFPESRRSDRHLLRSRLVWAGFGLLQNGLWLAPRVVDVETLVTDLDVDDSLKVFHATVADPTDVAALIADAWDLRALRAGYEVFLQRWDLAHPLPGARDDLARELWLLGEWTTLARRDPGLPVQHLPADWPAIRAEHVALRLRQQFRAGAERAARGVIETIRVDRVD